MCRVIACSGVPCGELPLDVGQQTPGDLEPARDGLRDAEQRALPLGEHVGILVGLAADHHAVDLASLRERLVERADAAVHDHLELRKVGLHAMDHLVAKGRDLAVLLRAEAREPGLARVQDQSAAARGRDRLHEGAKEIVRIVAIVDPDPGLDRDRHVDRGAHRPDARRDEIGLGHQAGAEAGVLHPIRGAADVQVDLVVAPRRAELGRAREIVRIGAAQLQRHRVLGRIEAQEPRRIAVQDGPGRDHLGVQERAPRDQTQKIALVPVGPVHHRGNGQAPIEGRAQVRFWVQHRSCEVIVRPRPILRRCGAGSKGSGTPTAAGAARLAPQPTCLTSALGCLAMRSDRTGSCVARGRGPGGGP